VTPHTCIAEIPSTARRDINAIFPDVGIEGLAVVTTCQQARVELVAFGAEVEAEKDRLLREFLVWAQRVCAELEKRGLWCDYIDPCSGLPVRSALLPRTQHPAAVTSMLL
jgi:Methylmalonic aciduria and homocystinuria type D protein